MTLYELVDLALGIGNRIDVQIGLFITVHLALFGGIIYVDRPLRPAEKVVGLIVYSLFAFYNYRLMLHQMVLMKNVYAEINALVDLPCCKSSPLAKTFAEIYQKGTFRYREAGLLIAHLITFAVVFVSVLLDAKLVKRDV